MSQLIAQVQEKNFPFHKMVRESENNVKPPCEIAGLRAESSLSQKGNLCTAGPVDSLWTKRITDDPRQQWLQQDECSELCPIR